MEAVQLWAGVAFSARGGNAEALLNEAAAAGLQLAALTPQPGGFDGRCAWSIFPDHYIFHTNYIDQHMIS